MFYWLEVVRDVFYIHSRTMAACSLFETRSMCVANRLVVCSQLAMKKVFGLDRLTPTSVVLRYSKLYSLEMRFNLKLYVLVYRCLNGLASPFLRRLFVLHADATHSAPITRGQQSLALKLPVCCTRYGYHSVSFLAADRWNMLPANCRNARSPNEFAHHVKLHLGYPKYKT